MSDTLTITQRAAAGDLVSFLHRARRVLDGSARLIASDGFLQCYAGILFPRGLLDKTPTVLGLRVVEVAPGETVDTTVPIESLTHRIEQALQHDGDVVVSVPTPSPSLQWTAVTPPRDGWKRRLPVTSSLLSEVAKNGITAISDGLPENAGEPVVQRIRAEVWGQPVPHKKAIPWGAGFAADALGFLGQRNLAVHTNGLWVRLSAHHGYVLVKGHETPEGLGEPED